MLYFAVTLTLRYRNGFNEDLQMLRNALNFIEKSCANFYIAPYKFELQPAGLHTMHVHALIGSDKPLNYKKLHDFYNKMEIHLHIKQIEHKQDAGIWLKYCNKYRGDLAYDYAESSGKDFAKVKLCNYNKEKHRVKPAPLTAQQDAQYEQWLREIGHYEPINIENL